jgi:hypothetical protein
VRSSTRRTLLWGFAFAGALAAVVAAYAIGSDDGGGDNERSAAVTATGRLQDAMIGIGAVGYELPLPERKLVDRTLAVDALGLRAR